MKTKIKTNPLIIISVVYLITHFCILILSGCWWDDWTFMSHNIGYINEVASQSGRPEWNILIPFCWSLKNNGRILIFFIYLLISYCVYVILYNSKLLDKEESLITTILFIIAPVNDARILISNFSYCVGLLLFYLASVLFVMWNNRNHNYLLRIIILIAYYFSFILNSLYAYYYVIFIYLFIMNIKNNKKEITFTSITKIAYKTVYSNLDFFLLPFLYILINKTFFPTYGEIFGNYNSITILGLIKCIKYIPLSIVSLIANPFIILFNIKEVNNWYYFVFGIIITIIITYLSIKKKTKLKTLFSLLVGVLILSLAIFPYTEVRLSTISSTGVIGRDAILTPLGLSIIIFSFISLFNNKKTIFITIAIIDILSVNKLYLEWQKDYYYQLSMENLFENKIIENNDTFYLIDENESNIQGQRFYSINANAKNVYNNETRLFINEPSCLLLLEDDCNIEKLKNELNHAYVMKDYNPSDNNLDAILIYRCDLGIIDTIILKYYEMFNENMFIDKINSNGKMNIIEVDDSYTEYLIEMYKDNKLQTNEDIINTLY